MKSSILQFRMLGASWLPPFRPRNFSTMATFFYRFGQLVYDILGFSFLRVSQPKIIKKTVMEGITFIYKKYHTIRVSLSLSFRFSQQTIPIQISGHFTTALSLHVSTLPRGFSIWLEARLTAVEKERFRGLVWVTHSLLVGLLERGLIA